MAVRLLAMESRRIYRGQMRSDKLHIDMTYGPKIALRNSLRSKGSAMHLSTTCERYIKVVPVNIIWAFKRIRM